MKCAKKNVQQQCMRRKRVLMGGLCLALLVCLHLGTIAQASAADIQIVCHPDVPGESLKQKELRNVFLGKLLEWDNKEKVVIAVIKDKNLHKSFLKTYVGMTPSKFRTYWKQMIFTGKSSSSPKTLKTEENLLEFVAETEGAIGYVSSDAQADTVKVLTISE